MPSIALTPPLQPKNGATLNVLDIERISTELQDEKSLDDQRALLRRWIVDRFDGRVEFASIASRGSGEYLDREEFLELERRIESGNYDLVIAEDLGRICRRVAAFGICELAEDKETRLIGINDHLDTAQPGWRLSAFFSVMHHEMHNRDTAARIRRTQRNRFTHGGVLHTPIFGYIKPPDAKSDADVTKDSLAEPIYDKWFQMLDDGASFSEIADWLNRQGVQPGPAIRSTAWNARQVAGVTYNPLLKGQRVWNSRMSKRINKTGRRKSVKAPPEERLVRDCPHLAFIDPERYDRIVRALRSRNVKFGTDKESRRAKRSGIPRKRTVWPGQSIRCGVCGRLLYYGAHGRPGYLICSGAINYRCWNSVGACAQTLADRVCEVVWMEIERLPAFDQTLLDSLHGQFAAQQSSSHDRANTIESELDRMAREETNLLRAIREGRAVDVLTRELERLSRDKLQLETERDELKQTTRHPLSIPPIAELKARAATIFRELPRETPEFGRRMNEVVRDLRVIPHSLIDGGSIVLRAEFTLSIASLASDLKAAAPIDVLQRQLIVDLFTPPQRVRFMTEIMRLTRDGDEQGGKLTERQIAARIGVTQPVVQRAKKLARRLEREGRTDPYIARREPPENCRLKRHNHARYSAALSAAG